MTERLRCIVPHCRKTRMPDPEFNEWICGKHWAATSKTLRDLYHARKRRWRKGDTTQAPKLDRLWTKLKDQALEGALFP